MFNPRAWGLQGWAAWALVVGTGVQFLGLKMFWLREGYKGHPPPTPAYLLWERGFILAAIIVTAIGFVLLDGALQQVGERPLARVGAVAFLFGGVLGVAAEVLGPSLVVRPQGRDAWLMVIDPTARTFRFVRPRHQVLQVERHVGVAVGVRHVDLGETLTKPARIDLEARPTPLRAIHAHEVVVVAAPSHGPFAHGEDVRARPQEVDLDQVGLARTDLPLFVEVGIATRARELVARTHNFDDRDAPLASI